MGRVTVQTWDEWLDCVAQVNSAEIVAWDWETYKTQNWSRREPMGIAFCVADGKFLNSWYLPVGHLHHRPTFPTEENMPLEWLNEIKWDSQEWVAHNAKFDIYQNIRNGFEAPTKFRCTQIQAHLLNENLFSYKLADLAKHILGAEKADLGAAEKLLGWEGIPPQAMGHYACIDTELCFRLNRIHAPLIEEQGLLDVFAESMDYVVTLMWVEAAGLPIDVDQAERASQACDQGLQAIQARLGWDPAKRGLAARILHGPPVEGGLGLPVLKRSPKAPRGPIIDRATLTRLQAQYTTNEEVVNTLQDVIDYRMLQKAKSTWFDGFRKLLDDDGMIHPGYRQDGTGTGRISSAEPNLQQIPRN